MPLSPCIRLGPYEVLSAVGAGGMGEIYQARDTRLERSVAIKVLPGSLASDAESKKRFEREARTVSNLSHPHICALYDVGHQDGIDFLVMEFLQFSKQALAHFCFRHGLNRALTQGVLPVTSNTSCHLMAVTSSSMQPLIAELRPKLQCL